MQRRTIRQISLGFLLIVLLVACAGRRTPGASGATDTAPAEQPGAYPVPYPVSTPLFPANLPTGEPYPAPGAELIAQGTATAYPEPELPSTPLSPQAGSEAATPYPYPPPTEVSAQATSYPEPGAGESGATYPGPAEQPVSIQQANPTVTTTSPTSQTAATPVVETLPLLQPSPTPGDFSTISIWHSWTGQQVQVLEQIIQTFQAREPQVSFDVLYVPFDELQGKYDAAAYYGGGPTLLFGDSEWGSPLYGRGLVQDLTPYLSDEFIESVTPPALGSVQVSGGTFALPYAMRGVVLYRNQELVPAAPGSFNKMLDLARQATRSGKVGLYLDWGSYFSGGLLQGLGGLWTDDLGNAQFNQNDYQPALRWLEMLQTASQNGALIEFNEDRAVTLFSQGKIGLTIDGSWNINRYTEAIGAENLAVDAWPMEGNWHMAGFVQADCVYINSNVGERSGAEQQAGLQFMGLMLTPEVQQRLAEVDFIPTVLSVTPRNPLVAKLMKGLSSGTPYPAVWQGEIRQAYWASLDGAAMAVLERGVAPREALEKAYQEITSRMKEINPR